MLRSVLLEPKNQRQWELALPEIGRGEVVGAVLPDDMLARLSPLTTDRRIGAEDTLAAEQYLFEIASIQADYALGSAFSGVVDTEKFGRGVIRKLENMHTDAKGGADAIPTQSTSINIAGTVDWVFYATDTHDPDELGEHMDKIEADPNGRAFRPAEITLKGLGGISFANGVELIDQHEGVNPTIHGAFSRTEHRSSITALGLSKGSKRLHNPFGVAMGTSRKLIG